MRDGGHVAVSMGVICHCRLNKWANVAPLFASVVLVVVCEVGVMVHTRGPPDATLAVHSVCSRKVRCPGRSPWRPTSSPGQDTVQPVYSQRPAQQRLSDQWVAWTKCGEMGGGDCLCTRQDWCDSDLMSGRRHASNGDDSISVGPGVMGSSLPIWE